MEGTEVSLSSLTTSATTVLTWLISAATSIINFMLANPLVMLYICVGLAFVGFSVVRRVIHR